MRPNETFEALLPLRANLALALRAVSCQGLSEGVCNHFSAAVPGRADWFLLIPRGLHWSEVQAPDNVMCNTAGEQLAGRHPVEPTAMFIHAAVHRIARKSVVLHTHMPHATALTLTAARALDTTLSQTAMRFHVRVAVDANYNGLALDTTEGERIANAMQGADVVGNHGVIVCVERVNYAYDDLYYLERACQVQVLAASTNVELAPVDAEPAASVSAQTNGERLQSELFFDSLRRMIG